MFGRVSVDIYKTFYFTYPFKIEIISACSRLLTDPASWTSYVKRQQQHQLPCLQFWKQQKDIQIPIQSTWKKIFIGTRLHFKVQLSIPVQCTYQLTGYFPFICSVKSCTRNSLCFVMGTLNLCQITPTYTLYIILHPLTSLSLSLW